MSGGVCGWIKEKKNKDNWVDSSSFLPSLVIYLDSSVLRIMEANIDCLIFLQFRAYRERFKTFEEVVTLLGVFLKQNYSEANYNSEELNKLIAEKNVYG